MFHKMTDVDTHMRIIMFGYDVSTFLSDDVPVVSAYKINERNYGINC